MALLTKCRYSMRKHNCGGPKADTAVTRSQAVDLPWLGYPPAGRTSLGGEWESPNGGIKQIRRTGTSLSESMVWIFNFPLRHNRGLVCIAVQQYRRARFRLGLVGNGEPDVSYPSSGPCCWTELTKGSPFKNRFPQHSPGLGLRVKRRSADLDQSRCPPRSLL